MARSGETRPPGNNTLVRNAMKTVVGDLENVLGELKTVVGDLRVLVGQIDVVTSKIDAGKKEGPPSPDRRHSICYVNLRKKRHCPSVRYSVAESFDILEHNKEWAFKPPMDFIKPVFPIPDSKEIKSKTSQDVCRNSIHSHSVESGLTCPTQSLTCDKTEAPRQSSREEIWYAGIGHRAKHPVMCRAPSRTLPISVEVLKPVRVPSLLESLATESSTASSSQGLGTLSSCSSLHPLNTHCSPCPMNPDPDAEYCGVYEKELELKLELAFDDELECYTGIDEGDTLDLKSYRLYSGEDDCFNDPWVQCDQLVHATQLCDTSKDQDLSKTLPHETLSDILNDNVISMVSGSQLSQISQEDTSSNYGTYNTWDDSDSTGAS